MTEKEATNSNKSPEWRKNLKPKEFHPMVWFVQNVFKAAGREYIEQLMADIEDTIREDAHAQENPVPPEENSLGIIHETFRKVYFNEPVNDRYLMGAALYLIGAAFPVAEVIAAQKAAAENNEEAETDQQEDS